ncbi:hypothetical protein JCM11251_007189 [Rhodosporidiobolus azoricus]
MSIRYWGTLRLDERGYDSYTGCSTHTGQVSVPGLPFPLTIAFDGRREVWVVEWTDVDEHIDIKEGSIKLSTAKTVLLQVSIAEGRFPPAPTGSLGSSTSHSAIITGVDVEIVFEKQSSPSARLESERARFAAVSSTTFLHRTTPTVLLAFPRSSRRLWASGDFLKNASPYFVSALGGDFQEGQCDPISAQQNPLDPYTYEESDDGTDMPSSAGEEEEEERADASQPNQGGLVSHKTIRVVDTAHSTYHAVLVWLQSRYIAFAPLTSSFHVSGTPHDDAGAERAVMVAEFSKDRGDLPPLVSPKSVYRLAHLLDLSELSSLALANLASQLTPENAAYELYSDVATSYPDIKATVLDYVVGNWNKVKEAKATKEMEEKGLAGELDAAALGTAMTLARRLGEKMRR